MIFYNPNSLTVSGSSYTVNLSDLTEEYYISGTSSLGSNWYFTYTGTPQEAMRCRIFYDATVTLGAFHMYFFGVQMPDELADKDFCVEVIYLNSAFHVTFNVDSQDAGIITTSNIADDAVTNDKLANITRGYVKVGGVSNAPTDLNAKSSGYILVGDGTDINSVAVSGDVTLSSAGAVTVANGAITNAKLASLSRGYIKVGNSSNIASDLNAKSSGYLLIGDGTDLNSVAMSGDATINAAGVVTLTTAPVWESGTGANSVQTVGSSCDASGDNSVASGNGSVSSGVSSFACGDTSVASGSQSFAACGSDATGIYSSSIGFGNLSSGVASAALNRDTVASGSYSVATGYSSTASGLCSFAAGYNTESVGDYSSVFGTYCSSPYYASKTHGAEKFSIDGDNQRTSVRLQLATTNAVADNMTLNGSDGIEIPTDCAVNVKISIVAVQVGGAAGTIGDAFTQNIEFGCVNLAGTLSVLAAGAATTANVHTVTSNVIYKLASKTAAFGGTVAISFSGNKFDVVCTGEVNKTIQWSADVTMDWIGFRNFTI